MREGEVGVGEQRELVKEGWERLREVKWWGERSFFEILDCFEKLFCFFGFLWFVSVTSRTREIW